MTDQTDEQDPAVAAAAAQRKAIADALRVELHYATHKGFERPAADVAGIRKQLGEPVEDTADHAPRERATRGRRKSSS